MTKGRKAFALDKGELQTVVEAIEAGENPPKNRNQLWKAVAATSWAKRHGKNGLSPQMAMIKAKAFNTTIKTPIAKKGRAPGSGPVPKPGTKRLRRFTKEAEPIIKRKFAPLGEKTVEKLVNGKQSTAIRAMCWDCTAGSKKEVSLCKITTCPLWPHRPWQASALRERKNLFSLPVINPEQ